MHKTIQYNTIPTTDLARLHVSGTHECTQTAKQYVAGTSEDKDKDLASEDNKDKDLTSEDKDKDLAWGQQGQNLASEDIKDKDLASEDKDL